MRRVATVEVVAHLAELVTRQMLYAAGGYGSLFGYCTQALQLSEDAACNRIMAARACRSFPAILDLLASGALSLASLRLVARHLTTENHQTVLARVANKSRREVEALVAELAPQPDAKALLRKLPDQAPAKRACAPPAHAAPSPSPSALPAASPVLVTAVPEGPRPIVQATAPERYRVQFTIGADTERKLRRLQGLMRREIPSGDPGVIFDRALDLLLDRVERVKLGKASRPVSPRAIRPGADTDAPEGPLPPRNPPNHVKRAVWARDGGQCAFVSPDGRRCGEQVFVEFHHRRPYALRGEATVDNIALRCRLHNRYEAQMVFGSA
jgi:hypothetical protein